MVEVGTKVRVKNDPSKVGIFTGQTKNPGGRLYAQIELSGGTKSWVQSDLLEALIEQPDAISDYAAARFSAPDDLRQLLTHVRLTGDLADLIYSMEATNTDFHAFQFKPVIKILNSPSRGLLIADEVGLGKTIEAGLVWTELEARYDVQRLLVVCPKSLQEKWRLELRNKFGARAQAVNAKELLTALKDAEANGGDFALVATLPGVRAPKDWEDPAETPKSTRAELARFINDHGGGEPIFDMVVFDEAHHLRNPSTAQHQTARLITEAADFKLMLSATPINLKSEDLRSILRLIEPELFDREWIFEELQRENEPIVAARELALSSKASLADLANALDAIVPGELLRTDRRLEILKSQLRADRKTDTPVRRVEIASRLEEMSMLGGIVNRTRRRDVAEIQVQRRAESRTWEMVAEEQAFYEAASQAIRDYAWKNDLSEGFLLANSQRMLASCLPAAYRRWASANFDLGLEGDDQEFQPDVRPPGPLVAALATCCIDPGGYARLKAGDAKYRLLRQAFQDTWQNDGDEKLIVFSSYRGTLDYLEERFKEDGVPAVKMHGGVATDRMDLLQRFREAKGRTVLLTSEVGGEGLDLQFCRILINYDLPWNPMRVEQRVGRIDRIGQRSPSVEVFNLICQGTIEARIYELLYDRLKLIERTLGGFEPILGEIVAGLEGRLLDPKLKPHEIDEVIERAATAAENRKHIEDQLEEEAAGLIAHGDMILQRIKHAHEQQRWIQGHELYAYVRSGLEAAFPGATLDRTSHAFEAYQLRLSPGCQHAFTEFLEQRAKRANTLLRRGEAVTVVFGKRPEGVREGRIEVITTTHPFVRFLADVRTKRSHGLGARPALTGRIPSAALPRRLPKGSYGLAIQRWTTGGLNPQDKLAYAGAGLQSGTPLSEEDAEALAGVALDALEPRSVTADQAAAEAERIRLEIIEGQLDVRHNEFVAFEAAVQGDKRDTVLAVFRRQLESHKTKIESKIQDYLTRGGKSAQIVPAERAKLARYVAKMEGRIAKAESSPIFDFDDPATLGVAVVEVY